MRDEHESGTENRHSEAADEHIDTDEKEKNKFEFVGDKYYGNFVF